MNWVSLMIVVLTGFSLFAVADEVKYKCPPYDAGLEIICRDAWRPDYRCVDINDIIYSCNKHCQTIEDPCTLYCGEYLQRDCSGAGHSSPPSDNQNGLSGGGIGGIATVVVIAILCVPAVLITRKLYRTNATFRQESQKLFRRPRKWFCKWFCRERAGEHHIIEDPAAARWIGPDAPNPAGGVADGNAGIPDAPNPAGRVADGNAGIPDAPNPAGGVADVEMVQAAQVVGDIPQVFGIPPIQVLH